MYLEAALVEVVETQLGRRLELPEKSPDWNDLRGAWSGLAGIDLERAVPGGDRRWASAEVRRLPIVR